MKIILKLIAYRAIIIISYVLIFPIGYIGCGCGWVCKRFLVFAKWLQTKLLNDE